MKNIFRKITASALGAVTLVCAGFGLAGCKNKSNPVDTPETATTVRYATPDDGSLPTAHTALENIGYLAYVLDNQGYYHAYAYNSSKSMGYEQITQTWKDYKDEQSSGQEGGVMICSDLTYSAFVKAGTQSCFIGDDTVYMRTSEKPAKDTVSTTAVWSTSAPTYYDKDSYLTKYGEFSTELSVYVINEDTVDSYGDIVVNSDGTYTLELTLNEGAGCYYQYGMKTRGGLKGYPEFKSIVISFTFDGNWQVLSSYCEEKTKITPSALGGINVESTSKTTTTFYYDGDNFDDVHYGYFDSYYKQYLGTKNTENDGTMGDPDVLTVLGSGFSTVVDPSGSGQQFDVALTVGQTDYDGKIFLAVPDIDSIAGALGGDLDVTGILSALKNLDLRVSLGVAGSGRQDLYIGYEYPNVKAYYSEDFALSANLVTLITSISKFNDWASRFDNPDDAIAALSENGENGESEDVLSSLLASLRFTYTDTQAVISLATDDLLGTGIGADVKLSFSRDKTDNGSTYAFTKAEIKSIKYSGDSIDLALTIAPDNAGEKISHEAAASTALLTDYMNGVYGLLNSNTVAVNISFDGDTCGALSYLQGVRANMVSYVQLDSEMAAKVDLEAEYDGITVGLSAYYGIDIYAGDYGTVYLTLNNVNGNALNANVYCNISDTVDALTSLLAEVGVIGTSSEDEITEEQASSLAQTINKVLNLNFAEIFGEVYAARSEIRISADIDSLISQLGIDVGGMQFGTAALSLSQNNGKNAKLSLALAALGLTVEVTGSDTLLVVPDSSDYLDLTELVNLVRKAIPEANAIIDAEAIVFDVDTVVTVDGVSMGIVGKGEADWSNASYDQTTNLLRLALDVNLSIEDGTSQSGKDTVALALVYDETAGDDEPLVRFAINSLGMNIYRSDISGLSEGLDKIIAAVNSLIGNSDNAANNPEETIQAMSGEVDTTQNSAVGDVTSLLTSENIQKILNVVFGALSDVSVELGNTRPDGEEINALIIKYATNGSFTLGVDGGLCLAFDILNDNGTQIAAGNASVKAGGGFAFGGAVNAKFDAEDENGVKLYNFYDSAEGQEKFVKLVYTYLFAVIEDLSVENVLGTKTYEVALVLNGADSGIPELSGVTVNASLYYTQGVTGDKLGNKLMEADVNLDVNGTAVVFNARYSGQYVYITLSKVGTTSLTGIKIKADVNEIYSAAEQLIDILTNENFAELLSKFGAAFTTDSVTAEEVTALDLAGEEETAQKTLTDVISEILTMNISDLFTYSKIDGVNTATLNIDAILGLLGNNLTVGTLTVGVNPTSHAINASITKDGIVWARLGATPAQTRDYSLTDWSSYIDISFLSTLISDITNTVTDENGNFYTLYSFSGTANVHVNVSFRVGFTYNIDVDIPLNITTLTAGLDEEGDFYFSLIAKIESKITKMGLTIAEAGTFSITYSKGYVTFGRDLGTGSDKFKVMTPEYLLDNLFATHSGSNDSPLRWMLGVDDTLWNYGLAPNVSLSSGLTTPQTIYMYEQLADASEDGIFRLASMLRGFAVDVNGDVISSYGTATAAAENLGMTDNYYALDVNGSGLSDMISALYAGLYRSDEKGIYGLKASGTMSASPATIKFALDLNNYLEGVTETSVTELGTTAAPNALKTVINTYNPDFSDRSEKELFGCYSTETGGYDYSTLLDKVTLTVVGFDGESVEQEIELTTGSTVYLTNVFAPVWANDEHTAKIFYRDENGNDLGDVIESLTANKTIYADASPVTEVKFVINKGGITSVIGAVGAEEELSAYALSGYAFLGWYNDEQFSSSAENLSTITNITDGVKTVYGWYVKSTVTAENGVVYTFNADSREYAVTGYNQYDIVDYTVSGSVLYLENEIDGYRVTSIAANAFANAGLKNVVVPENIVQVGEKAFLDNYGIESVVFLADSVNFDGKYSDNSYPFYGCSVADGGETTVLNVYYNNITTTNNEGVNGENNPYWSHFRTISASISNWTTKYRYIGNDGGSRNAAGTWTMVGYTVNGSAYKAEDLGLKSGIVKSAMTSDEIAKTVHDALNEKTVSEGYINAYAVTADRGFAVDGKLNSVVIDITEGSPNYLITVSGERQCSVTLGDGIQLYNGNYYVKAGVTVTLTAPNGFAFDTVNGEAAGDVTYSFVMPSSALNLTATYKEVQLETSVIYSAVGFSGSTYNGNYWTYESADVLSESTLDMSVEGYIFLGWASESGANLEFTDASEHGTYYAIWAVARDEITGISVSTSGTLPEASVVSVNSDYAAGFAGWYTDNKFSAEVTEITAETTVLYARLTFSLKLTTSALSTNWYYSVTNGDSYTDITVGGLLSGYSVSGGEKFGSAATSFTINVLEGYNIEVYRYWSNAVVIKIYDGTTCLTYLIKGIKPNSSNIRNIAYDASHYMSFTDNNLSNWKMEDGLEVSDGKYYETSASQKLFASIEGLRGNIGFTVAA